MKIKVIYGKSAEKDKQFVKVWIDETDNIFGDVYIFKNDNSH